MKKVIVFVLASAALRAADARIPVAGIGTQFVGGWPKLSYVVGESIDIPVVVVGAKVASGAVALPPPVTGTVTVSLGNNACTAVVSSDTSGDGVTAGSRGLGTCRILLRQAWVGTGVSISYSGNTYYLPSFGGEGFGLRSDGLSSQLTVAYATPTVTIGPITPSVINPGQQFVVPVSVKSNSGIIPSGTVTISGPGTCSIVLDATGAGNCVFTAGTNLGSIPVSGSYSGDQSFNAAISAGTSINVVASAPTSTTIVITGISPSPTVGQSFSVSVRVSSSSGTPTGRVLISMEGSGSCSILLSGGSGSCSLNTPIAGSKTVTATYQGEASWTSSLASASLTVSPIVEKPTLTTITSVSPVQVTVGQPYTVFVSVTSATGSPTGTVSVSDGYSSCVATLTSGAGSCVLTSLQASAATLTAHYFAFNGYAGSDGTKPLIISQKSGLPTTTTLTRITAGAKGASGISDAIVEFSVGASSGSPTGNVIVSDGYGSTTCSVASKSCSLSFSIPGAKTIVVTYMGDSTFSSSSTSGSYSASTPITEPPKVSLGGVVGLNNSKAQIQPGSWASIYGSDLASGLGVWKGEYPTTLNGTSVTINGKDAYLWYVSPNQINFQAPDDDARGPVQVKVTTENGTSFTTVTLQDQAPSFNLLDSTHIAGIILRPDGKGAWGGGTYDLIGPTGSSLGYPTVAARAGDSILLYGTGFGPTTPAVRAGASYSGAAPTKAAVQFTIGGRPLIPTWSGLSAAGLYQFNIALPSGLAAGDLPIQATVNGVSTPIGVVLSVQ